MAIVDGQSTSIWSASKEQRKSNIYKAVITRVEPSLEACFVDYGADRHGFLPFKIATTCARRRERPRSGSAQGRAGAIVS